MGEPTMTDELLLLCHDPATGRPLVESTRLTHGLAGAMIADLALGERVAIDGEYLHMRHPTPTGDPNLDRLAHQIAAERRTRKIKRWVTKTASARLRAELVRAAVGRGVLEHATRRVLGVFTTHTYRPAHPGQREELHQRLRTVLQHGGSAGDARSVALLALCGAVRADGKLFPDLPGRERRRLVKEAIAGDAIGQAVRKVIQSIEAATAGAVSAAAAGGSGS